MLFEGLRGFIRTAVLVLAVIAAQAAIADVHAQSVLAGGTIAEVRVEGTQRIEPETVRSYLRLAPGDQFDPVILDDALKRLFATGLFADVALARDGDALVVRVVENPIINRIAFEGNERLDDDTLSSEIELRPRRVFTRTIVQNDVQRVQELYRRNGRFAATVEPKIIELDQNRVDLVFEIDEGPRTVINSINFVGNKNYSDGRLRDEIASAESVSWNFLQTTDTYDPDRLTFDRELLRRFYLSEGYADFQVVSAIAELTPDRSGFIVTFTVEEGERYKFGAINLITTLKNLDTEALRSLVTTEEGEWYDASEVEDTITELTDFVGNLGYAFVDIRPVADRDRENLTIGVTYEINEGPRVFVERIDIEGNVRTLDKVIRREFRLVEGDAFNTSKLRRSRSRIQNLGFFRTVNVENEVGSTPDRTIITVEVEEQSTGDLIFGAGFSSSSGPLGNVGLRERNLLGRGQDLRLNFSLSGERSQIDLSFTEPYFLDRNLSAGIDIFRVTTDLDETSFDESRLGGSLRAGYNLTEHTRQVLRYTIEQTEIEDIDPNASLVIVSEAGTTVRSIVGQEITYDTRDSRFDPRKGYVLTLKNDVAGLGGDVDFLRTVIGGGYHYSFTEDVTISVLGEAGSIFGLTDDTRIADRFFVGGQTIRGFETTGVGPRDAMTNDPLGAKTYYAGTLELGFPLGLPEELSVRGRVFTDFGAAWDLDTPSGIAVTIQDSSSPRLSVGAGLTWDSPFGPVLIDLGFPVVKEDFDETEVFRFSFGTRF